MKNGDRRTRNEEGQIALIWSNLRETVIEKEIKERFRKKERKKERKKGQQIRAIREIGDREKGRERDKENI